MLANFIIFDYLISVYIEIRLEALIKRVNSNIEKNVLIEFYNLNLDYISLFHYFLCCLIYKKDNVKLVYQQNRVKMSIEFNKDMPVSPQPS